MLVTRLKNNATARWDAIYEAGNGLTGRLVITYWRDRTRRKGCIYEGLVNENTKT